MQSDEELLAEPLPGDELPPIDDSSTGGVPAWLKILLVGGLLFGSMLYLLLGSEAGDAFVYSRMVPEVVGDPGAHMGRELRVEGDLRKGSVLFREDPCEWRFEIEREGKALAVSFPQCVVPDTFRDDYGIIVTVQGRLQDDGSFVANQVVPRCPSKYEQKLESGETMPAGDHRPAI